MPIGLSIHVGLECVDSDIYGSTIDPLNGPGADATAMCEIAKSLGYSTALLINQSATLLEFRARLNHAAECLQSGDILLITFSGHGDNVLQTRIQHDFGKPPGCGNPPTESDGKDEQWCFYDGKFIDNEFYDAWCRFRAGVRVVLVADSCMSGTMELFAPPSGMAIDAVGQADEFEPGIDTGLTSEVHEIPPIVLVISASHDNSRTKAAGPGETNSRFTQGLLKAWDALGHRDTYQTFYDAVVTEARKIQSRLRPSFRIIGRDKEAIAMFLDESPFSILNRTIEQVSIADELTDATFNRNGYNPNNPPTMNNPRLKFAVRAISEDGSSEVIVNAPVILFNSDMTINIIGFTERSGECTFVGIKPGQYFAMAIDPGARRYRIMGQYFADVDLLVPVIFSSDPTDKGRIKATVLVGGASRSSVPVKLFVPGGTIPIVQKQTNESGETTFDGLVGVYDVEANANGGNPVCKQRMYGFNVPVDDEEIAADFSFPGNC